jgi:hypothetical protein
MRVELDPLRSRCGGVEREPESLRMAGRFLVRRRETFIEQLSTRAAVLKAQFDAIDVLKYRPTFEDAAVRAERFLKGLPADRRRG